jgi:DNA-binding PucR family transcriptional regulator
MVLLARLVEDLGRSMYEIVVPPRDPDVDVAELVIHDPYDPVEISPRSLVLAPGIDLADAVRLVESMGAAGGAALLVKPPLSLDASLVQSATRSSVALLSLPRGVAWGHAIGLLTSILTQENFGLTGEQFAGVAGGDLFAVANAIAAVVDAPITIEDRQSRLLAYSGRQDEADEARKETILGRRVPERFVNALREAGVFRRLLDDPAPIFISDIPNTSPRVAIAVRAGDEVLGSIWAAVGSQISEAQREALVDSAKLVALHMLRNRAGADVERRLRADLLATVLEGRGAIQDAAARLGLEGKAFRVLAMVVRKDREAADESWRSRLWDALALHLAAVHSHSGTALLGGVVYAVLPVDVDPDKSRVQVQRIVKSFLARSGLRSEVLVAIGGPANRLNDIARSRIEADQVLRVLRTNRSPQRIADIEETRMKSLMLRLADLVESEEGLLAGKLGQLRSHDAAHSTSYLPTLGAYLEAFGDIARAAEALHIHPNTLRYRINKLQELSGIDLADPSERLDLMLQQELLRILAQR